MSDFYETLYPNQTMILFSRHTDQPLAALIFKSPGRRIEKKLKLNVLPVNVESTKICARFHKSQENYLEVTVVNFSKHSHLSFDIHRLCRTAVYAVNKVNCLPPLENCTVSEDQRTHHALSMSNVLNYSIVLYPEKGSELDDYFAEGTTWKLANHAVRNHLFFPEAVALKSDDKRSYSDLRNLMDHLEISEIHSTVEDGQKEEEEEDSKHKVYSPVHRTPSQMDQPGAPAWSPADRQVCFDRERPSQEIDMSFFGIASPARSRRKSVSAKKSIK